LRQSVARNIYQELKVTLGFGPVAAWRAPIIQPEHPHRPGRKPPAWPARSWPPATPTTAAPSRPPRCVTWALSTRVTSRAGWRRGGRWGDESVAGAAFL